MSGRQTWWPVLAVTTLGSLGAKQDLVSRNTEAEQKVNGNSAYLTSWAVLNTKSINVFSWTWSASGIGRGVESVEY